RVQVGNTAPCVKVAPRKSAEIRYNRLGGTAPRMPRTVSNDYLPLECIHLIDGDPQTCWSSKSQPQPDAEPVWIRLDLPVERLLTRIVLHKRAPGAGRLTDNSSMPLDPGAVEVGMAMPAELTIKISRDARTWETVFEGQSGDTPDHREFVCDFTARPAKQIWIIGRQLRRVENWLYSFSIAGVDVIDNAGNNVALATRGTGVTVSSTQHSMGQTREDHHWLWPLATDIGVKWIRIGYHDDPVNWHWVEQERGKLAIDPEADAAIDYLVERGVDIVLALGFGNRLYTQDDPVRKLPQLWEWYYENPRPPITPAALKAWARYVRYMARKYRGRVKVFEIWNEWNIGVYWGAQPNLEQYLAIARSTIPILRRECPQARVMLGSYAGYFPGMSTWSPEELARQEGESMLLGAIRELARDVDIIGWHPFYQTDPDKPMVRTYSADVRAFQAWCRERGFRGEFCASEWSYGASYPEPTPPNWWGDFTCSECAKAKYVARLSVQHTALACDSFFCETWGNNYYPMDLTLMRRTFGADPISPQQPQAAYYVMRNLATALEDLQPAAFEWHVEGQPADCERFAMARTGERVVTLWQTGRAADDCAGVPVHVVVAGAAQRVVGYDPLNGVEQELMFEYRDGKTHVPGVLVKDYPLLLRLIE
ncbi:MAG: discoidin domain-containing protein, partial [Chloroflexi bacterium]|nr:discoidin domain-containing protein [Chloroflexota bacterium]